MSQYLTAAEYKVLGLPASALEEVLDAEIDAHLTAVSGRIDSYLEARYALPLSNTPDVLKRICADLANWHMLLWRGFNPESEDNGYKQAHDDAVTWLEGVVSGKYSVPGAIDATPTVNEGSPSVRSSTPRGW